MCLLVQFLTIYGIYAQSSSKSFINISVDKGLSQSTVFSIAQDVLGFIWVGTQDGLNRYDGKTFRIYKPLKDDKSSISSYYIFSLFVDKGGKLWVGGNGGLSLYNANTDSFKNYTLHPKPGEWYVTNIIQDQQGGIWSSTNTGEIYKYDLKNDTFKELKPNIAVYGAKGIYCVAAIGDELLLGTENGLFFYEVQTGKTRPLANPFGNIWVNYFYSDGPFLWIGTEGKGLLRLDTRNYQFINHLRIPMNGRSIADNNIRGITKDANGKLWIGTFGGLSIFDGVGNFENYYHHTNSPLTLSQNSVRCIFRDRQGGMWLGTYYGGLNYFHNDHISFNLLSQNTGSAMLNDKVVNVIKEDNKGNFWIGTNDRGVDYWQPKENAIRHFAYQETGGSISSNNIKAIAFDTEGKILLGTHNSGLNILDPKTGYCRVFRHLQDDPGSISGDMVYALLKDHSGKIWVGTKTGLDQFDDVSGEFNAFKADKTGAQLSSMEINFLMEDSKKRIWIGTNNGLNIYNLINTRLEQVENSTLSNDVINFIAEDKKGRIWIGTRDGLNLFDESKRSFINYKDRPDFTKGTINSILPDEEGNLWLGLSSGLVKYNTDSKQRVYFDGLHTLQNTQLNLNAACRAKDGMMLFGGINGISYFYPKSINHAPLKLRIVFTGLELFNKTISAGDGSNILDQQVDAVNALQFNHEQKQFTIFFNTFNFIAPNSTKYSYKLDGYDQEWQQAENIPKASYANLPAGKYIFRVKATGSQGEQSPERSLEIIIKPIWYKTTWFYLLLAVSIAAAGYIVYRILIDRIQAKHQLKLERIQREKNNYLNKVKMDFFTNVSHEFRTPLSLIMAPLEEILARPGLDRKLRRSHELIMRNTKRLFDMVNQLLDFRKTELGTRKLQVAKLDLVDLTAHVSHSFTPLSDKQHIDFTFIPTIDSLVCYIDRVAVESMLYNLLSNAFKYSAAGDSVRVELEANAREAIIRVKDTGRGMAQEHLHRIFESFYQIDQKEMNLGSGVGLAFTKSLVDLHHGVINVSSELGQGSIFTIILPLADDVYAQDIHSIDPQETNWHQEDNKLMAEEGSLDQEIATITTAEREKEVLMIVDDNREIVTYLAAYFRNNYTVITAFDGKEALGLLSDNHPDAIISDVMMPEMDGLHFCKKIKQNIQTSHIPIILLTAKSEISQQLRGFEMGTDDYILKPFSIALLDAKVKTLLRTRDRLRNYYKNTREIEPEKLTFNQLDQGFLEKTIAIIESNLDEYNFSVEILSQELGMSRTNLYLKIKAITGDTVTAMIKRIRLKKAVELLRERKHSLSEIAYKCGFNTPSYFSTAFKQVYGCMPSEYLEKQGENTPPS
ncbi:two-component regulator propeller domain-containing protein [Sphingobacterium detergens]|uniref:histidine kinase n=1 Tax=Sphingobacterium detergens TaxID=1145106 RepID=A0A420BK74_SPHD1|nr:two-component regulator propeller domain-containing protein [Sphingobacterium detergens]RKE57128.1 two component regulator with propeller domain [Sphingobacterium detergens]